MPFGLKNAEATYQRLVDKMFHPQLGRNMEVYVDDMTMKSEKGESHIKDLEETFEILRRFGMKLNPKKCAFGVRAGKFLGYMVTECLLEVNPEKVEAIMNMKPPRNIHEVQVLTGNLIALSRFTAQVADKWYPFFKILRKGARFAWDEESDKAFNDLKKLLADLALLAKHVNDEKIFVYLVVGPQSVSSILLREDLGRQIPIYYTSKFLKGTETNYFKIEKLGLALVTANHPLKTIVGQDRGI